jgi:hypothetical protein
MERMRAQFTWIGGNAGSACPRGLAMPAGMTLGSPSMTSEP